MRLEGVVVHTQQMQHVACESKRFKEGMIQYKRFNPYVTANSYLDRGKYNDIEYE
jgi:hypothetical protein